MEGLCVRPGCKRPAHPQFDQCWQHSPKTSSVKKRPPTTEPTSPALGKRARVPRVFSHPMLVEGRQPHHAIPAKKRVFRCSHCSTPGHTKATCPHLKPPPSVPRFRPTCTVCRRMGHNRRTCPDVKTHSAKVAPPTKPASPQRRAGPAPASPQRDAELVSATPQRELEPLLQTPREPVCIETAVETSVAAALAATLPEVRGTRDVSTQTSMWAGADMWCRACVVDGPRVNPEDVYVDIEW